MKAEDIYAKLDEIREMVADFVEEDGTVAIDPIDVRVATGFCKSELQKALERGKKQKESTEA